MEFNYSLVLKDYVIKSKSELIRLANVIESLLTSKSEQEASVRCSITILDGGHHATFSSLKEYVDNFAPTEDTQKFELYMSMGFDNPLSLYVNTLAKEFRIIARSDSRTTTEELCFNLRDKLLNPESEFNNEIRVNLSNDTKSFMKNENTSSKKSNLILALIGLGGVIIGVFLSWLFGKL